MYGLRYVVIRKNKYILKINIVYVKLSSELNKNIKSLRVIILLIVWMYVMFICKWGNNKILMLDF